MATRSSFKHIVTKTGVGNEHGSLIRFWNRYSCHPQEYGLKKGLRRARRRLDKEIVTVERREAEKTL